MAENPRTTSARDHDDTDIIEGMIPAGAAQPSSAGGHLQTDIGSQDDVTHAIDEPGGSTRPEKADDVANDQSHRSTRSGDPAG